MNNYMEYIKCGEILRSPSLNYKEQYILKCIECKEFYSVLEALLNHSTIHCEIKGEQDSSNASEVDVIDPLKNNTMDLSNVLKVEMEDHEPMIDDNVQMNVRIVEVCKTDDCYDVGFNEWTGSSSDGDVLDDTHYGPVIENASGSIDGRNNIQPEISQKEDKQKTFVCDECGRSLKTYKSLIRHQQRIHLRQSKHGRQHECEYCKRVFQKLPSLKKHLRSHRENGSITVAGINDSTDSSNYDDEDVNVDCEKQFQIKVVPRKSKRNDKNVAVTLEITNESRGIRISPAPEISRKENKPFVCDQCGRQLKTRKSLERHHLRHLRQSGEKVQTNTKYECEHCKKVFQQSSSLRDHLRIHTAEQPYLCSECGRAFKSLGNMKQHFLRHGTERRYECPDCPKKFPCLSDLASHKAVHSKTKTHICDVCGAGFIKPYLLKKHKMYHNGEKNHKCDYCDMRFVIAYQCRRHMRTHTGEKPYKCKYCVRAFAQSNDLMKHLRVHLGDNVYKCDMCPQGFRLQGDLRAHFSTHKNDDDETRLNNLQALKDDELRIQKKFGIVRESEKQ